jgi:5,10-methenyltetrahydrofolate synthetase
MSSDPHPTERGALRQHLLAARRAWNATPAAQLASATVIAPLRELLDQLEPAPACEDLSLALPFAQKGTGAMHYRRWDGAEPAAKDDCGIPTSSGAPVVPDVVLVPCVGFTREGFRLGYGGGYFDRWLAAHPGVTTIGLAWSGSEAAFAVEPHDQALTLILTEAGLITPE